ncbi:GNAT family N-acyltransferase [Thermomonas sp.]|uniref:GNAT family N-acetyltransferase n=1 Tax=Thermomonas sp. TaxID=1971895 RepID=UPI00248A4068|nr:GNAT family N-acyltransferase [Thermomonas sp.]MDI1253635.1 GNAT family N-acetyltransferase [Thermomonas sp.]
MGLQQIEVRLARTGDEIAQAQRLRYEVFYEEYGARPDQAMLGSRLDVDPHDAIMDHLLVIDHARSAAAGQVVGNYRLLPAERLGAGDAFYSSAEFDLAPLLGSGLRLLELGRSCVKREYRALPVLQMLWRGIAEYGASHRIELLFGCASLREGPERSIQAQLALLHHAYLAPPHLRPVALPGRRVEPASLPTDRSDGRRGQRALEPLVRGYLRAGAWIGDGGARDDAFDCVDVCIVMPTSKLTPRYQRHFQQPDAPDISAHSS